MPRQPKFKKEDIVEAAIQLVRERGEEALSARHLAAALGCSTAPLFVAFSGIEEIYAAVKERAWACYMSYHSVGMAEPLPFKGSGRAYVRFAKEEPQLFRFLFMKEGIGVTHYMPASDPSERAVRGALEGTHALSEDAARRIYNHMSVYAHGLATLFAVGNTTFTDEDVDRMLTEVFYAVKAACEAGTDGEAHANGEEREKI